MSLPKNGACSKDLIEGSKDVDPSWLHRLKDGNMDILRAILPTLHSAIVTQTVPQTVLALLRAAFASPKQKDVTSSMCST
eukprot:scaffold226989_cov22-Tisochrysis_lutea.AAC.1